MDGQERTVSKLEAAVSGNGKEGLQTAMTRVNDRLESISEYLEGIPEMVGRQIESAMNRYAVTAMDTDKVRAIVVEELRRDKKDNQEAPGSWHEFRKQWLFPVAMMIISALVSALLTYIVVAGPK